MTDALICPTCHQPMPDQERPDFLVEAPGLMPLDRKLIQVLIDCFPRSLTRDQLADAVYALDPQGGPDGANNVIACRLVNVRRVVVNYGWRIPPQRSGPGSRARYRLEKIR